MTEQTTKPADDRTATGEAPDLDAIEARAKAATPGPWESHTNRNDDNGRAWGWVAPLRRTLVTIVTWNRGQNSNAEADARFIAHAREDVPALVAEVRRLREAELALVRMVAEESKRATTAVLELEHIKEFAERHHAHQSSHKLLHALQVDIPALVDDAVRRVDAPLRAAAAAISHDQAPSLSAAALPAQQEG